MSDASITAANLRPSPLFVPAWPSETALLVCLILASLAIYGMLIASIFGGIYALFIALFLFFGQVMLVTHVRGSGVRLGPEQFPQLHARVVDLARRIGLDPVPEAYLMQEGGALNAFATKLFRGRLIVLYTDLLEACGEDQEARDMVIGHELGHHRAGHLDWLWLKVPGMFVPFLGAAYSRACERTCDRYGLALCGDARAAIKGLCVLAAGGKLGPEVSVAPFVAQTRNLDSGFMTLGRWLSGYPPLAERVALLDPALIPVMGANRRGPVRAAAALSGCLLLPLVMTAISMALWLPRMKSLMELGARPGLAASAQRRSATPALSSEEVAAKTSLARHDLERLAVALEAAIRRGEKLDDETTDLAAVWKAQFGDEEFPKDPFDGADYGFLVDDTSALVWSSGPDERAGTDDDIDRHVSLRP